MAVPRETAIQDQGSRDGLTHLIAEHDRFGVLPTIPDILPDHPAIPDDWSTMPMGAAILQKLGEILKALLPYFM